MHDPSGALSCMESSRLCWAQSHLWPSKVCKATGSVRLLLGQRPARLGESQFVSYLLCWKHSLMILLWVRSFSNVERSHPVNCCPVFIDSGEKKEYKESLCVCQRTRALYFFVASVFYLCAESLSLLMRVTKSGQMQLTSHSSRSLHTGWILLGKGWKEKSCWDGIKKHFKFQR